MHVGPTLLMVGLSLVVAGSALPSGAGTVGVPARDLRGDSVVASGGDFTLYPRPATGEALPFEDRDAEEMAATTRSCRTPWKGETKVPCAATAVASGGKLEVVLTKVETDDDPRTETNSEQIHFNIYEVGTGKEIDHFSLQVGAAHTYTNKSEALLDLAIHARNDTLASARHITFTYEKK